MLNKINYLFFIIACAIFLSLPVSSYAEPEVKPRVEVKDIKLEEVVIKSKDETLLTDIKKASLPEVSVSMLAREQKVLLNDEIKEKTKDKKKRMPHEPDPGCMFSNACVSIVSKALKGDEGYFKTAIASYLREEYNTAYDLFKDLVKKYPNGNYTADAYYWIAEMNYWQYKRPDEAKRFYRHVIEKFPGSRLIDYAAYSLAFMYYQEENYQNSKKYGDLAFKESPAGNVAQDSLMISLLSSYLLSEHDDCLKKCDKIVKIFIETKYADIVSNIKGNIFFMTEQYEEAKKEFKRFIEVYKESDYEPYVLYGLGLTELSLGKLRESIAPNEKILKDYPEFKFNDSVMFSLIRAYGLTGMSETAMDMLDRLDETYPSSPFVQSGHYEIAYQYFSNRKYDAARERFLLFTQKFPASSMKGAEFFMLAGAEMQLKRYSDAIKHYVEFMRQNDDEELVKEAMLNLSYAYYLDNMYKEAADAFEKIVSRYGTAFEKINEVWYFLGESYYKIKDFNKAMSAFKKVDSKNAYYNLSVLGLGWVKFHEDGFEEAVNLFTEYLASGEKGFLPETHLVLAESYFNLKKYDDAMTHLRTVTDKYPKSDVIGKVDYLMGLISFRGGDFERSSKLLKSSSAGNKKMGYIDDALYWLGWSYFKREEYDKAATVFTNLVSEYPKSPFATKAILKIGDCYYNLKMFTTARLKYKSMIEAAPGSESAAIAEYGIIQTLYSQKNYEEIEKLSKAFVEKYPGNDLGSIIFLQLAEHFEEVNDHKNAASIYGDMAKLYPDSELADDALYKSGRIHFNSGKTEEALNNFLTVTKKYADSNLINENNYYLANAYFATGRYKEAIEYYDITTKNMPETDMAKESFKKASEAYLKLNVYDRAADELVKAAKMFNEDPFDRKTYIEVGDIYFDKVEYDKAIENYKKALDSTYKGVGVSAQMKIADSYYMMGDYESSLLEYLKIIYLHKSEKEFVDDAYFKIGELYVMMDKKEEAKKIYERLQNESMDPDKIGRAIEKLKELETKE